MFSLPLSLLHVCRALLLDPWLESFQPFLSHCIESVLEGSLMHNFLLIHDTWPNLRSNFVSARKAACVCIHVDALMCIMICMLYVDILQCVEGLVSRISQRQKS